MSDFSFSQLDPSLILDAIESLGIRVSSGLLALNSYENRVYQFSTETHGKMVVKFYRPKRWDLTQIQEEHDFATELQNHDLPVVAPLVIDNKTLHSFDGYHFALFRSVGGREFEVDNLDQIESMGRLIGRIHLCCANKPFKHRPSFSSDEFLTQAIKELQNSPLIPASLAHPFFTIIEQIAELAKQQYDQHIQHANIIRLHGDCHPGNILWRDGASFVDLDDCRSGPAIQDLWMMLSGDDNQRLIQLETLIEAYEEFYPFSAQEFSLIEPLRTMRMVHYMAWLSKRWQDPAFPRAFPWFAEAKYWETQILAMKEQLSCLMQEPISLIRY